MPASGEPSGQDGPHTFVADLDRPALDPDDRHHLARVLRLRDGDPLTVSDGRGRWRPCRFGPSLVPQGDAVEVPEATPRLTIAFALVKGDRPESVTRKLTELGIDVIRPFVAARSVVRWDERRAAAATARLRRVAREASMQCRRCRLPEVHEPVGFASVAALAGAALADRDGSAPSLEHPTLLIGPEGGWDDDERAIGLPRVGLGPHVLRADTAAISAAALLGARAPACCVAAERVRWRPAAPPFVASTLSVVDLRAVVTYREHVPGDADGESGA